jgi:hypothetical protein
VLQHQAHQATHALGDQRSSHAHAVEQQNHQNQQIANLTQNLARPNPRLRKACDSCSIRKVRKAPYMLGMVLKMNR